MYCAVEYIYICVFDVYETHKKARENEDLILTSSAQNQGCPLIVGGVVSWLVQPLG